MTDGVPERMATLLHVVDYSGSDPQTARLVEEVLARLPVDEFAVGIVSSGAELERARALAGRLARPVEVIDVPALVHRFAVALGEDAQFAGSPTHEVLADTFIDPGVVWFPQLQFHLPAHRGLAKIVAGIPDVSLIEMAEFLAEKGDAVESAAATGLAAMADMALRRVAASPARLVAPSGRVADHLAKTYGCSPAQVILPTPSLLDLPAEPVPGLPPHYIIYAGGIGPLGNHESLLMAQARLKGEGKPFPLVLAGEGTSRIAGGTGHRGAYLKGLIDHLGLVLGTDVHILDDVTPGALKTAFSQSSGVILPALAEDAALLAAGQAAELGVPLAASDMAGPRDYFSRRGIAPLWFRPGAADEIAAVLGALRAASPKPPARLPDPGWDEVAQSYLTLFREQAILAASQSGVQ